MNALKKAVVTEAFDSIGYALCRRLLDEGIEVEAFDRLKDDQLKEDKLGFLVRHALFHFHDGRPDETKFRKVICEADICYWFRNGNVNQDLHKAIHKTIGKIKAFQKAVPKTAFIVLSSTTDVYRPLTGKIDESSEILPVSAKGILSFVEEALFSQGKAKSSILRFPKIISDQSVKYKDLFEQRMEDLLHIDDAIEALYLVARKREMGVYNIASGVEYQMQTLSHNENVRSTISSFNIEKANQKFGFFPIQSGQADDND